MSLLPLVLSRNSAHVLDPNMRASLFIDDVAEKLFDVHWLFHHREMRDTCHLMCFDGELINETKPCLCTVLTHLCN